MNKNYLKDQTSRLSFDHQIADNAQMKYVSQYKLSVREKEKRKKQGSKFDQMDRAYKQVSLQYNCTKFYSFILLISCYKTDYRGRPLTRPNNTYKWTECLSKIKLLIYVFSSPLAYIFLPPPLVAALAPKYPLKPPLVLDWLSLCSHLNLRS